MLCKPMTQDRITETGKRWNVRTEPPDSLGRQFQRKIWQEKAVAANMATCQRGDKGRVPNVQCHVSEPRALHSSLLLAVCEAWWVWVLMKMVQKTNWNGFRRERERSNSEYLLCCQPSYSNYRNREEEGMEFVICECHLVSSGCFGLCVGAVFLER